MSNSELLKNILRVLLTFFSITPIIVVMNQGRWMGKVICLSPAEIGRRRPEPFNLIRIMPAEGMFNGD
jgi:hypothetical protein